MILALLVAGCGGTVASTAPSPSAAAVAPSRPTYYHASEWVPKIQTLAEAGDCAGLLTLQDTIVQADVDVWKAIQDGLEACAGPTPEPTAEPTPEGPTLFQPGDVIEITQDAEQWATVTISKVREVKKYDGEFGDDTPAKGNVYLEAVITYTAVADGVDYGPFDWQVFVDGQAVENFTFVSEGPTPELGSGTLPKGRKASGYVVYEVPTNGQVLLSYGGSFGDAPVFEVEVRGA